MTGYAKHMLRKANRTYDPGINLKFGFQVTAARKLARLSQAALARRAGINVITLRRIEAKGELPITARRYSIQAIERALANSGTILLGDGRSELIYPVGRLSDRG